MYGDSIFNSARGTGKELHVIRCFISRNLGASSTEGTFFMSNLLHEIFCEQFHINKLFPWPWN